ncbi:MAG: hypothetical protein K2M91_12305 [Lachnospiraceae bacterium]|nr:hypothetical protein [Lachnospiraceae bacterium]
MGHCIQAIIGVHETIQKLAENWLRKEIELPQGYGMVFMTNAFVDELTELFDIPDEVCYPEQLDFFTAAIEQILQENSFRTKLAYIETDYFGGVGTQAGVLYENGRVSIEPCSGDGTINLLLKELGVWCVPGKDDFDSLNLGRYRRMSE